MRIHFEEATIHLSNCLDEARPTRRILSFNSELEEKLQNKERHTSDLCQKQSLGGGSGLDSISVSQQNNRSKR